MTLHGKRGGGSTRTFELLFTDPEKTMCTNQVKNIFHLKQKQQGAVFRELERNKLTCEKKIPH